MPNWLLPENIADVLPSEARKIEDLRRQMLDTFRLYGYELVMPPLLEYVESLLAGAGQDTDLRTFKLVDQLSGRLLGLRADMTTQVARIERCRNPNTCVGCGVQQLEVALQAVVGDDELEYRAGSAQCF